MSEDAEDRGYRRGCADAGLITAAAEDLVSALQADVARLEGERDEARTAWAGAVTRLEDVALALGDWRDFQAGARTAQSERQSDAEGSGVAQDVREALGAQKGVQGAEKCRCGHDGAHHTWRGSECELCFGCDSFERTDRA